MPKMEVGLAVWMATYHTDLYVDTCMNDKNHMTPELYKEYREWLKTEQGSEYVDWKYFNER